MNGLISGRLETTMKQITENDTTSEVREKLIALIEGHCGTMLSIEYHKITTSDLVLLARGMKLLTTYESLLASAKN